MKLQWDDIIIVLVRKLFETVEKHITDTDIRINAYARIVESTIFELV